MIDHRKLLILVITISLVGVLSLFLYSTTIKPTEVSIAEIDESMVGDIVKTGGMITYSRTLSEGSLSILISDVSGGASIRIYIPNSVAEAWDGGNLTPGAVLEVIGEVDIYGEEVEISVSSAENLEIISAAGSASFELWQILESLEVLEHMNLTTTGKAYDIAVIKSSGELVGTSFVVTAKYQNSTYSLDCMYFDEDLTGIVEEGDGVSVTGALEFYTNKGCWQLIISDIDVLAENKTY